tara:strand:- start:2869 stop:4353 length:1485 start_codon:yes stop_codon:yes gene_type:complete
MFHKRKTKRKVMVLDYWLNDNIERKLKNGKIVKGCSKRYVLGDYHRQDFNVKAIEKKIADLRTQYGSKNSLTWDVDIHEGEQLKKRQKYNEQVSELQRSTFNDCIKSFFEANCPQIHKPSETLHRTTIVENLRYLIGYNERTKALKVITNERNQGEIEFKEGITSWQQFWNKYPPKDYAEIGPGKSIFDTPFGQKVLADISEHDVRYYLNTLSSSPGTKKQIKECFSYVWNHAKEKSMLGANSPQNPVLNIKIEKPTKSAASKFNKLEFTDEQLAAILDKCEEKKNKYPFQSFVLKMQMYTGRRRETILKLKWSMIKWYEKEFPSGAKVHGHIEIPGEIVKTKNDDQIWITPILKDVIIEQHKTRELHHWAMFIDWMCPSIRVKDKNFLRKGNENNTDAARMKDVRGFWDEITSELGITGEAAQRMFRNTHENRVNAMRKARSTWDVISVTGRADTRSAESYYLNKKLTPQTAELMDDMNDQWEKVNKLRLVKK